MGFMIITMFLSMWLSNTATTAMMIPIVDAVLHELEPNQLVQPGTTSSLRKCLMMGTAYAANLGGTGTIIGTGPNLFIKGFLDEYVLKVVFDHVLSNSKIFKFINYIIYKNWRSWTIDIDPANWQG